ncbi:MAG: hypothetical protein KC493_07205 [Bacteriovoracaceae bacterium]|nr:hypothetical protein [Bacteriovoracaceae bacterium]
MKLDFEAYQILEIKRPTLSPYFSFKEGSIVSDESDIELPLADLDDYTVVKEVLVDNNYSEVSKVQDVLNFLGQNGMITENETEGIVTGLNICHDLFHGMKKEIFEYYKEGSFIYNLLNGEVDSDEIEHWIKKCFLYTWSAERHITGVATNPNLSKSEKDFWDFFCSDEKNHWKIYTELSKFYEFDMEKLPHEFKNNDVENFVQFLFDTGQRSAYEYAALLFMMELPPTVEEIEDDPQFGTLIEKYEIPKKAMKPLFDHAFYNESSDHCDIWYNVLRSRDDYSKKEKENLINNCKKHCELAYLWNRVDS